MSTALARMDLCGPCAMLAGIKRRGMPAHAFVPPRRLSLGYVEKRGLFGDTLLRLGSEDVVLVLWGSKINSIRICAEWGLEQLTEGKFVIID